LFPSRKNNILLSLSMKVEKSLTPKRRRLFFSKNSSKLPSIAQEAKMKKKNFFLYI
jgi:hypothetical protein